MDGRRGALEDLLARAVELTHSATLLEQVFPLRCGSEPWDLDGLTQRVPRLTENKAWDRPDSH